MHHFKNDIACLTYLIANPSCCTWGYALEVEQNKELLHCSNMFTAELEFVLVGQNNTNTEPQQGWQINSQVDRRHQK